MSGPEDDAGADTEIRPVSQLRVSTIEDVDRSRLRRERLTRLQSVMGQRGVAACLFFEPVNIRYATGVSAMDVWAALASVRYCLVAARCPPILFEQEIAVPYSSRLLDDVRVATWWQWLGERSRSRADQFAGEIKDALHELGLQGEPLAVDRIETLGYLALQDAGLRLTSAGTLADAAREVKTPEEVKLLTINGAIGEAVLAEFESAIRPGVREYELFAVLSDALMRRHGELVFTRLVSSGKNTNPWGSEAHDKTVMAGDLVAVDTDACGYEGYLIDVSRTFHCGTRPTREQIELYRVGHECVTGMRSIAEPGMSYREFAEAAPDLPERFKALRYDIMVHGAGLEDEGPIIYYPGQGYNPDDVYLQENMALCFECYVGAVGGPFGVKLEDQVLLTADGAQLLCTYPYDARLLGLA